MLEEYAMDETLLLDLQKALSKRKDVLEGLFKDFYASDMMLCNLEQYESHWQNGHC